MKNTLILLIAVVMLWSVPYFIGKFQYANACMVIENITDKTDGEIEDVLYTFDFQIDCFTTPSFSDYYISGTKTIERVIHLP